QRDSQARKVSYLIPSMIIDGFIYHGTIFHARNINLLEKLHIRNILNVCNVRLSRKIVDKYHVFWINLQDDFDVDIRVHFDQTNEFLQACRNKNEKVLIHCRAGVSRSSSIVLAYLLRYYHDILYNAYHYLIERRSIAMSKDGFFLQIILYEKDLHVNRTATDMEQSSSESINTDMAPSTVD
ncbi:unnamed protein product, partial [Rotaria socialis]